MDAVTAPGSARCDTLPQHPDRMLNVQLYLQPKRAWDSLGETCSVITAT
jgi:hypothetical protein